MCDLKNYTLENEEVFTGDVVTSKTEKVMLGVKLYIKGYSEPIQTILEVTLKLDLLLSEN